MKVWYKKSKYFIVKESEKFIIVNGLLTVTKYK